jgi:hypothetical protein
MPATEFFCCKILLTIFIDEDTGRGLIRLSLGVSAILMLETLKRYRLTGEGELACNQVHAIIFFLLSWIWGENSARTAILLCNNRGQSQSPVKPLAIKLAQSVMRLLSVPYEDNCFNTISACCNPSVAQG